MCGNTKTRRFFLFPDQFWQKEYKDTVNRIQLTRKIRRSLRQQGFRVNDSGVLPPGFTIL